MYTHIAIIFNPKSTGDAKQNAEDLKNELIAEYTPKLVALYPTQRAGHAIELAQTISQKHKRPLIISVSGDGGYNEVINGAYKAKTEGADPVVAVYGAGNANDHQRVMHDEGLVELIRRSKPQPLDLLELSAGDITRVAHSYIGVGLSPYVGYRLNKYGKRLHEAANTLRRTFHVMPPVSLKIGENTKQYDSVVCANINEMAKHLTLSKDWSPNDGKFELVSIAHRSRWYLIGQLLKQVVVGVSETPSIRSFAFTTTQQTMVQLDGEIEKIAAAVDVKIKSLPHAILSLYTPPHT